MTALRLRWSAREPPLAVAAVAGRAAVAARLRAAAIARGSTLRATGNADWLILLGPAADLPWADGALYLGWEEGMLVPCAQAPWPPAGLVRPAVLRRAHAGSGIVALLPHAILVSPVPVRQADLLRGQT